MSGHSVLAVPVPELDAFVRERTARQDASFLGSHPEFVNAHVTLLGPWLAEPTDADLAAVAEIVAAQKAFDVVLGSVGAFPDGIINILPEPSDPFARLTAALVERFPQTPPYAGQFEVVVPHLTLDHHLTGATIASVTAELADLLPVRTRVERVDLQWWANDDCHVRETWRLG
jgi:2'-5' RNA ligase